MPLHGFGFASAPNSEKASFRRSTARDHLRQGLEQLSLRVQEILQLIDEELLHHVRRAGGGSAAVVDRGSVATTGRSEILECW
jgi:hypothetical protein